MLKIIFSYVVTQSFASGNTSNGNTKQETETSAHILHERSSTIDCLFEQNYAHIRKTFTNEIYPRLDCFLKLTNVIIK